MGIFFILINIGIGVAAIKQFTILAINIPAETKKINLEQASLQELITLPGIGYTLAKRIIIWRDKNPAPYQTSDLLAIKGIGPTKLQGIIKHLDFSYKTQTKTQTKYKKD